MAKLSEYIFLVFCLMYVSGCLADCGDFKKKCQQYCLAKSGGVATNQCWGSPKYRHCKCDDMTIYHVPGYTCQHPSCPDEAKNNEEFTETQNTNPPLSIIGPDDKQHGCKDFKSKCQTLCLQKSGGVAINQCWGKPTYRYCQCDDQSVHVIPGYSCDHPTCPSNGRT